MTLKSIRIYRVVETLFGEPFGNLIGSEGYSLTHSGLVRLYGNIDLVNIGSDNGLFPDSTKASPEPKLIFH